MEKSTLYIVIGVAVVALILLFVLLKKRKPKSSCPIDLDALITALGGLANITSSESSPSTLKVTLNDFQSVDVDAIKALGASGIVQGGSKLTMIFGKASREIEFELAKRL